MVCYFAQIFIALDSLSQIVLGAAVGEIALGKKIGNKAQLIGAIAGTIPDLDILLNPFFTDEIFKLQIHRGYSHSMFVHLLLAIPFAWMCYRIFKRQYTFRMWYVVWYLCFLTHTLLDCCTTYGTQLFLPFTNYMVGFDNISVVDPFWTFPFMICLIVCLFLRRENHRRIRWAWMGVLWCFLYMGYTCMNKHTVHQHITSELERQHIKVDDIDTPPSIFNNWLWGGVATTPDTLWVCEYSVLQQESEVEWVPFERNEHLLTNHPAQDIIKVLKWFSQGKYIVREVDGELHFFVCKWGRGWSTDTEAHKAFFWYFEIVNENGNWVGRPVEPEMQEGQIGVLWKALWKRVVTSKVD
ncbi:MAG: metal-dependent hydrolase [Flavobacteriales bacterium]